MSDITGITSKNMARLLFPFRAARHVLSFALEFTGRFLLGIIGIILILVGALLAVSIIAAPVGLFLLVIGFALLLRGFF